MSQEGKSMRQAMRAGKQTCSRHVLQYERNSSATGESCSCKGSMRPLAVMLLKKTVPGTDKNVANKAWFMRQKMKMDVQDKTKCRTAAKLSNGLFLDNKRFPIKQSLRMPCIECYFQWNEW